MIKDDVFIEEAHSVEPDYTTERNKPMPNRIHGRIEMNIGFHLRLKHEKQYDVESEVTLDTKPKASTPDLCIFPKKTLWLKDVEAKTTEMPLTTIEIQSPSQSPETLVKKAWDYYFPAGVKSAWVVIPSMKAVRIILPDNKNLLYMKGEIHDPTTDIRIAIEEVFKGIEM